jgi:hypothetical protein
VFAAQQISGLVLREGAGIVLALATCMRIVAALLALQLSACSYLFVVPPHRSAAIDCTTSKLMPGTDTALTALTALATLIAVYGPPGDSTPSMGDPAPGNPVTIGVSLGWLLVFGTSAIYGFYETGRCRSEPP